MAIRPDYTVGSLTLTSGSANFTTTGSALQTAAVQAGDEIITRSGDVLIIATITGQNSGTLFQNCPASAAGAGQPLRIRFQPDGSRYQGAVRDLIEKLASGNVEAIAGLASAADTLPYFTGAGTADITPLTPAARALINLFGNAGTGKFAYFNSTSGAAVADIVGTISSGSLMQVGYNNGWYWRYRNGMQITCVLGGTTTINSPAGSIFVNGAAIGPYAHPAAFIEEPFCHITSHKFEGVPGHSWAASVSRPSTTQSPSIQLFRATASTDIFFPVITCFGRFQ